LKLAAKEAEKDWRWDKAASSRCLWNWMWYYACNKKWEKFVGMKKA